ncbi:unnamed protein product, partial [Scytosiphon promiscuus]
GAAPAGGARGAAEESPGRRRFYNDDGLLLHLPDAIFECHARCACNPQRCKNRVVSRGVHLPLQVFRCADPEKGWGLRCLESIPAGSFVACYLGEVLTDRSVDDRGRQTHDDYVFSLDFASCIKHGGSGGSCSAGTGAGGGPSARLAVSPVTSPSGSKKWGSSLSFSPSPRGKGGPAAAAAAAAGLNARLPAPAPSVWCVDTGGGDKCRGVGRASPSLGAPRNNARSRKKTKRSAARSPLAAAS